MPIMNGCCCFVELINGAKGSAVFTGATGIINVIIDTWILIRLHAMTFYLEPNEQYIWMPPGIIAFMYIELVLNLGLIGLSMMLWVGINYRYEGKKMVFGWVWGVSALRVYHIFLLMYICIWIGGHRVTDVVFVVPESLVIAIYWILNCIILIAALLCVVSYWQELFDELYGKEKRRKRFYKITNIRQANRYPGTATPSTYWGSRATLQMSRPSSQAPPRSTLPSQSSGSLPYKA